MPLPQYAIRRVFVAFKPHLARNVMHRQNTQPSGPAPCMFNLLS